MKKIILGLIITFINLTILNGSEFVEKECLLVEKSILKKKSSYTLTHNSSKNISFKFLKNSDLISAICANTKAKKLLSIDEIEKEHGDDYISLNLEDTDGCQFFWQLNLTDTDKEADITVTTNYNDKCKNEEKPKEDKNSRLLGNHVCYTWASGKNGWCGNVTQVLGNSVRVENYRVFCGKGGFLGICTNITGDTCTGDNRLFTDDSGENYKNPSSIIVPVSCLD